MHPRVGGMMNPRGVGKGAGGDKSCHKGCFKANLCFCIVTPPLHPPNAAESGEGEGAGGGWLAAGQSLTPALLTPDFHGALADAAVGDRQGQAGEQQAQEAGGPQLHPRHLSGCGGSAPKPSGPWRLLLVPRRQQPLTRLWE